MPKPAWTPRKCFPRIFGTVENGPGLGIWLKDIGERGPVSRVVDNRLCPIRPRMPVVPIATIRSNRLSYLPQITGTLSSPGALCCFGHHRKSNGRDDRDDGHHNQQFDKCECFAHRTCFLGDSESAVGSGLLFVPCSAAIQCVDVGSTPPSERHRSISRSPLLLMFAR